MNFKLSIAGWSLRAAICLILGYLLLLMGPGPLQAAEFTYRDKLGRSVTVETPVERAAVLQLYDCIPPLNIWGQVCCLPYHCLDNKLLMSLRPNRVRQLSADMGVSGNLNMEKLIKLSPDVVLIWSTSKQQIEFMQRRGLKVISVYPESLSELYGTMDLLGRLFGRQAAATATARQMDSMFDFIHERVKHIPAAQRQKVLYISSRPTSVSAGIGLNNDLIRLIGATNVAGQVDERNIDVSLERIIKWNPDIIFIWGGAPYAARDILQNPQWRMLRAVRTGRVYKSPKWSTWSPLVAPTALWMAARTYPVAFREINLNARIDTFYRQVYGVSYARVKQIEN